MQELFDRLVRRLRIWFDVLVVKTQPGIAFLKVYYGKIDYYYKTHPRARKWSIISAIVFGPPFLFLFIVWVTIPSKSELRNIQNQVASEVYSADSVLLGRYYIQDRTEVKYEDISPVAFDALVATEDIRFYDHNGVDYTSLGRVLVKSIFMQDESAGGGSTITQQLAKNLYPRKKFWILAMPLNKAREVITALRLEDIYEKKDLITMYLNTVTFADQTFGIESAAKRFFSCTAKELAPTQAALLIGMLKATHSYNPRLNPQRALLRRNVVLNQMVKYKYMEKEVADSLKVLPLGLNYTKVSFHQGLAPYFREYIKGQLMEWCKNNAKPDGSAYNIYTDGLKIYTTIDSRLQRYAEEAVEEQMAELQRQFNDHWGKKEPWDGKESVITDAIHRSTRYAALKEGGLSEDEILSAMQKKVPMRIFTWQGDKDVVMSPIDSIKHHIRFLNAGFMALDPQSGNVKAWVGGIDHDFFQYDHVKETTKRQVGSIFKPIVYAMALEQGADPCEFISAERKTYIDKEGEEWTPRNSQIDYEVKYSMPGALAYSVNTVAVKLIDKAGVDNTIGLARRMGINSDIPDVPSIALGSSSISLQEMTSAFATFDNDGISVTPYFVGAIYDHNRSLLFEATHETGKRVIREETNLLVRRMMQTVIHEGTASRLRWKYGVYNDVAGKTGTTQANADGWFMALTPGLVVGTWVGADDPRIRFRNTELGQGSNTALPLYGYFMQRVNKDSKYKKLSSAQFKTLPQNLQERLACDLYELNESLVAEIKRGIEVKDSTQLADTLYKRLDDTFLEKLYKRKLKLEAAQQHRDSLLNDLIPDPGTM